MTFCIRLLFCLLIPLAPAALRAADAWRCFTLDLPSVPNAAIPAWLGQPVSSSNPFATLDLPVVPPDSTSSLLITVFFQEQSGGFLRIGWQCGTVTPAETESTMPGPGGATLSSVLCENFYEGIGMINQRSLLVPADVMKKPGALNFQTGSATLGITSIRMEWLENTVGLTSPDIHDVLVTPAGGPTQPASELAGLPPLAQDPAWHGRIVSVPVTDVPLRIEQGIDFPMQIDGPPALARLALKEAGLPWGQHIVVWVNDQRAGLLIPATPRLDDGGYARATGTYIGWRDGSFFVPTSALSSGINTMQFSAEPDVAPTATNSNNPADPNAFVTPLAIKDVVLQLVYPAIAPATASPASVSAASTTAAAAPASSVATAINPTTSSDATATTATTP